MGLARALAVGLAGMDGQLVEVECDISAGLPGLAFTGSAASSVVESRDRLRAAVLNSGPDWPNRKITVALLPADVRKIGSRFDLAVGLAVLAAAGQVPADAVAGCAWIGELGPERHAATGHRCAAGGRWPPAGRGVRRVVVARANAAEAALVDGLDIRAAHDLGEILLWLRGRGPGPGNGAHRRDREAEPGPGPRRGRRPDRCEAGARDRRRRGAPPLPAGDPGGRQDHAGRAAAGIAPRLDDESALEVTAVHSVAGLLPEQATLLRRPPLQAPHHTASMAALVGGGSFLARPGAISLAHNGVLFLDEASEFSPQVLDALRQPLESGHVVLMRGGGAVRYPARFQLVLAANPCGCAKPAADCECTPQARRRHHQRLSGPLMDRIDLRVPVAPIARHELFATEPRPSSAESPRASRPRERGRRSGGGGCRGG